MQKFFRRITLQNMLIYLRPKKKIGVRCTLSNNSAVVIIFNEKFDSYNLKCCLLLTGLLFSLEKVIAT